MEVLYYLSCLMLGEKFVGKDFEFVCESYKSWQALRKIRTSASKCPTH